MRKEKYIIGEKVVNAQIPEQVEYKRLEALYDTCNELFKSYPHCFYTKEQLQRLKENPTNNFIKN